MKPKNLLLGIFFSILGLSVAGFCRAANLTLDTFEEGALNLMLPGGDNREIESIGTLTRRATIRRSSTEEIISTTQNSVFGNLRFDFESLITPVAELNYLQLAYGPVNLFGVSEFHLTFSNLVGGGELIVRVNDSSTSLPLSLLRIPLTSPGTLVYPDTLVNGIGSADATSGVDFTFIAKTSEFSFELDEIAIVPEPAISFLLFIGSIRLIIRRRR